MAARDSLAERLEDYCSSLDSHPELWNACAAEHIEIPAAASRVYYFVQGHVEQGFRTQETVDLERIRTTPHCISCTAVEVSYFADRESDDVYTRMTLQPLWPGEGTDAAAQHDTAATFRKKTYRLFPAEDGGCRIHLTKECAKLLFPQVSEGEYVWCKDVHGVTWQSMLTCKIPSGGQPEPVLSTGWGEFVKAKKLMAGDYVVLMRDRNGDLRVGIRRGKMRSVVKHDVHLVERAAELGAAGLPFQVLYYPHLGTPEFVVTAARVEAATRIPPREGLRFIMPYEDEATLEARTCAGTVWSVQPSDPVHWPYSPWRLLQVRAPYLTTTNVLLVSPWMVKYLEHPRHKK